MARTILLAALTDRARTRSELAALLAKRRIPQDAIEEILGRFADVGLIDDTAFARAWVDSRQQRKHLSRRALRVELGRKGVDRDEIDAALATVTGEDEHAAALALAQSKAARTEGLDRQTRYRRLAGVLGRRGFSSGTIQQVLREVLDVDEEL